MEEENKKTNNRDITIDILKAIGLLMIILAHTAQSNGIIMQLRNFDVPLMVIISGMLAIDSYKKVNNYSEYFKKRVLRLILPTYVFLTIFFIIFIGSKIIIGKYPFSFNTIMRSYLLIDGIGYVWIIRVYLLCALIVPILIYLKEKLKIKRYVVLMIAIYICYELIYMIFGDINYIFKYIIYYIIPYGCLISLGMELNKIDIKHMKYITYVFITLFIISSSIMFAINRDFLITNIAKYPPRIYYLSYALAISMILIILLRENIIRNKLNNKIILFIGKHTMWIYLWQILYIYMLNYIFGEKMWVLKYIILCIFSISTVYVQNRLIDILENNNKKIRLSLFRG